MFDKNEMVAEFETIQERVISGKGVLKVPTDKDKNRCYVLFASVVRPPKNLYVNRSYNPSKSRYGTIVFLRKGYVISDASVEYPEQAYDGVNDVSGQTLIGLKCAYQGMLESFFKLSAIVLASNPLVPVEPVTIDNLIKEYTNLRLAWDECRLVCYADTAISLRLMRLKYDTCDEAFDDDKPPPPPPPPQQPPVPPGTPIDFSPPYDPSTNDNDNTKPYEGDKPEGSLPVGALCQKVRVTSQLTCYYAPNNAQVTSEVFGPVYGVRANLVSSDPNDTHQYQIECHGLESCGARQWYTRQTRGSLYQVTLISATKL